MNLGQLATHIEIPVPKLRTYALNPNNPVGKHKARVFERALGFTQENYLDLLAQLQQNAPSAVAIFKHNDQYGEHYFADLTIVGANGKTAQVRTGWLIEPAQNIARLTTLYVKR